MRRVAVTGLGIVSPIGNSKSEVLSALMHQKSGIVYLPAMAERNFKCCVYGAVREVQTRQIPRRTKQTMSNTAIYAAAAALDAIKDARLTQDAFRNDRTAVVLGTWLGGINEVSKIEKVLRKHKSPSRAGGTAVVKLMNSTASGNLASLLGTKGRAYSVSSACASGVDNIGHAYELIKYGLQDLCICGATEEESWAKVGVFFDNCGAMPTRWNRHPEKACRPFSKDREGFVMSEGAGVLILEPLEDALARGASVYAEIVGYGSANDGNNMFEPTGEGLKESIEQATAIARQHSTQFAIDYINSHGLGSKIGDAVEVRVFREVFGSRSPLMSSTKALTGHAMGATGAL
ncbi:MAG: hypothetical protein BA863_18195, partial [Desulfovibrio sp. S3730MH75]